MIYQEVNDLPLVEPVKKKRRKMKQTQNHPPSSPAIIYPLLGYVDAISIRPLPQTKPRYKSVGFRPQNHPVIILPISCPEDFSFRIPGYRTLRSHSSLPGTLKDKRSRTGRYMASGAPRRPFYKTVSRLLSLQMRGLIFASTFEEGSLLNGGFLEGGCLPNRPPPSPFPLFSCFKSVGLRPQNHPVIIPVPPYLCPEDFSFGFPDIELLDLIHLCPDSQRDKRSRTGGYIAPGAPRRPFYETVPHLLSRQMREIDFCINLQGRNSAKWEKSLGLRPQKNHPVIIPVPPYLCPEDFSFRIPGYRTSRSHSSLAGLSEINDPRLAVHGFRCAEETFLWNSSAASFIAPDAGIDICINLQGRKSAK
ncbi:hypothetical protein CEXT_485701 [Caerostris extrusa]|uniref:Uncharacterized protein n=1 Tax=Caerostris extrusa TaxID=172846 RepID=A0AAV4VYC7_CAEEX|nr:hypothetical protein CEXT_485701 [Caerostris extrusa]